MEPEKKDEPAGENEAPKEEQPAAESSSAPENAGGASEDAPADALSRTPEDLEQEESEKAKADADPNATAEGEKKLSPFKRLFRKVNLYFLIFLIVVVIAGVIAVVNYLNSQKAAPAPNIATQTLSQDALKQLANTDATVGDTSQTLTIQGNAIIAGQTLTRGNLNVAGNLQSGGSIQGPSITISGTSNLGTAQINTLQVAGTTAIQGTTTLADLNVSGISSFNGAVTAGQLTVTKLIMSGNAILQIPNHISFTGSSPSRSINNAVLGDGGTANISGSDTTGTLNISTGNNPTAGCFAQITFQQPYTGQPRVVITPVGVAGGQTEFYVNRSSTSFSICTANAAPANQSFSYDYFITG